jgi:ABC-type antimicrobial peptide transport system permease subunit
MNPLQFDLSLLIISILAGVLGALLGLGGGIIIIPALTLLFNLNIPRCLRRAQLNGVSKGGEHPLWSRAGLIPRARNAWFIAHRYPRDPRRRLDLCILISA